MSQQYVSVNEAIKRGQFRVNGPVTLILILPIVLVLLAWSTSTPPFIAIGIAMLAGFVSAWIYWSWALPKWRLWAYEHVEDLDELIDQAITTRLMWPPGHFFERTEIKSVVHRQREQAALEQWEKRRDVV